MAYGTAKEYVSAYLWLYDDLILCFLESVCLDGAVFDVITSFDVI